MSYGVKCPGCEKKVYSDIPVSKIECPSCGETVDMLQEEEEIPSFKEWLEAKEEDAEFYISITKKLIEGKDVEIQDIDEWHKFVIDYNKQFPMTKLKRTVDFRTVKSWIIKNKGFKFYDNLYKNAMEKEHSKENIVSSNVFYSMFRDFSNRALIPEIEEVEQTPFTYYDESSHEVVDYKKDIKKNN